MKNSSVLQWLLEGDISIQYQTYRDLLDKEKSELQKKIEFEGWAAILISKRHPEGYWGRGFYQPKWISSHYTLLDLRNLCMAPGSENILKSIEKIALENKSEDGGINPAKTIAESDVCINGMFLNYASYFGLSQNHLNSVVDFIITQQMPDGGFNCNYSRYGAVHSSLHSTLSIAEGICEYLFQGYQYRKDELRKIEMACREFILIHRLYISDRTGKIINKKFLRLPYPGRWFFDILRALDYFQYANCPYDERMEPALEHILKKECKDGTWKLQAHYPGKRHLEMETVGKASRWNTLRALRTLHHFNIYSIR